MKKLMRMVMVLVGVGMMLGFAGCGMVEDSILKSELAKMAKEQLQGHDELMKLWTVEKSSNFTMSPEENGKPKKSSCSPPDAGVPAGFSLAESLPPSDQASGSMI